jgi:hypothetical protein
MTTHPAASYDGRSELIPMGESTDLSRRCGAHFPSPICGRREVGAACFDKPIVSLIGMSTNPTLNVAGSGIFAVTDPAGINPGVGYVNGRTYLMMFDGLRFR